MRLRVRFGPEPDLAGGGKGVVRRVQVLLAVEEALDMVAGHGDLQLVPASRGHGYVGAPELDTPSIDDLIDPVIVFQVVLARDVIVLQVAVAPDRPAALLFA